MSLSNDNSGHRKIAVFGSAFNPPSLGHRSVLTSLDHFDQVLLLPSISHAWGKEMLDYQIRCDMVRLFISDLPCTNLVLSQVEASLLQPNRPVATYDVLCALQESHPNAELTFVIGPDNFLQFNQFYKCDEILDKWAVLVCPEKIKIRSSLIREYLKNGSDISKLTTSSVVDFIANNNLYR